MKNKLITHIFIIIASLTIIFTCYSCDDIFEQKAGSRITPENHYSDSIDIDLSLRGAMTPLTEVMPNLVLIDGLFTDMMDVTSNADSYMEELNEHTVSISNPYINPAAFYKTIINLNEVLKNIDRVQVSDPNVNDFYIRAYKGALIGLRTWVYFTLSKLYGEVAWIEDNLEELPTTDPVYIQKNALLDTLINQLKPYIQTNNKILEIRVQKYPNNKALIGEMYLEQDRYDSAAYYLKLGMESHGNEKLIYKVTNEYEKERWQDIFTNSEGMDNSEIISVIPFDLTEGQTNPLFTWSFTQYAIKPSNSIIDLFLAQTPLKGDIDYRGIGTSIDTLSPQMPFIKKYILGDYRKNNIILSRAGDIHLLLAEAVNRLGDTETALALLNHGFNAMSKTPLAYRYWVENVGIRGRAYLKKRTIPKEINEDPDQLMIFIEDLIIEERALELAFEGKRWFDLTRIARRRNDVNYIANIVTPKYSDQAKISKVSNILK
ncbi:MAG TPA: RagB/SusD family nutrient uptake outer membrane protein, partial [Prolixibacteraceae bacterium]|nr:RagB/SusD family nutrient uptake outer membrane protein [Prolixibacteraceae bacterium]